MSRRGFMDVVTNRRSHKGALSLGSGHSLEGIPNKERHEQRGVQLAITGEQESDRMAYIHRYQSCTIFAINLSKGAPRPCHREPFYWSGLKTIKGCVGKKYMDKCWKRRKMSKIWLWPLKPGSPENALLILPAIKDSFWREEFSWRCKKMRS